MGPAIWVGKKAIPISSEENEGIYWIFAAINLEKIVDEFEYEE